MAEVPAHRQSELDRLVAPANAALRAFFRRLPLLAALCAITWALSGLTVIQGDEVGLLLRNGRLHRATDGSAARPPGLLFALPRPFDEVLRLPIKRVFETELNDLHFAQTEDKRTRYLVSSRMGIDPEQVGYALTGDQNVLHCAMIVRWQIGAPEVYGLQQADPEALLRAAVVSARVQTLGELPVDTVLSDGRQGLVSRALRRAQVRLDALDSGVALLALELGAESWTAWEAAHSNSDLPPILPGQAFMAQPEPEPPQLVDGILHQGAKMVLGGPSKARKSWSLIDLMLSVATGTPWWGFPTRRGRALYLNFELPPFALQYRIHRIAAAKQISDFSGFDLFVFFGHDLSSTAVAGRLL